MAAGTVQLVNGAYDVLFGSAGRNWDTATTGNCYWWLTTGTPTAADATTSDITGLITTAATKGAPIAAAGLEVTVGTGTSVGKTYFQGGYGTGTGTQATKVSWGASTTITAKYLICTQPTTADTPSNTTDKIIFYVALNTSSPNTVTSTNGEFTVNMPSTGNPSGGWFYVEQT